MAPKPDYEKLYLAEVRARQEAEDARQAAEDARQAAEKAHQEAESLIEKLQLENKHQQPTNLAEYIEYCHRLLFLPLEVELDSSKNTGGPNTKVDGKYYPAYIRRWSDFTGEQRQHFNIIEDVLGDEKLFFSPLGIRAMKTRIHIAPVASEEDLKPFEYLAVEAPVCDIINALCAKLGTDEAVQPFNTSRVYFSNQTFSVSQENRVELRETTLHNIGSRDGQPQPRQSSPTKKIATEAREIRPDRFCIRERPTGEHTIAFVIEYKAAHRIQVKDLRRALVTDLFADVIKRKQSTRTSSEPEQGLQDSSDLLIAEAIIQTFDYMIKLGLEYSLLTAGKSLVFLQVKADNPRVVYYHLLEAGEESDGGVGELMEFNTAVAQLASFCLLALRSRPKTQASISAERKTQKLKQWPLPYSRMKYESDEDSHGSSELSQTSDQSFDGGPTSPPKEFNIRLRSGCRDPEAVRARQDDGSDSEDSNNNLSPSNTKRSSILGQTRVQPKRKKAPSSSSDAPSSDGASSNASLQVREYCTQACLLGLKRRWKLDKNCPNISSHQATAASTEHPIDAHTLACLMQEQLRQSRDRDCESLDKYGMHGARGTLFKLTLTQYGYTFVGKGTVSENLRYMMHEADVYARLERVQGKVVPVFLGSINLDEPYYITAYDGCYFAGATIRHMLLMSWAGEAVRAGRPDLTDQTRDSMRVVRGEGVLHDDERSANLLWNAECGRVMVIDFDRAFLVATPKHRQINKLTGSKRQRRGDNLKVKSPKRGKSINELSC